MAIGLGGIWVTGHWAVGQGRAAGAPQRPAEQPLTTPASAGAT